MFKLLTDKAREDVMKEYALRRLIVGLGGVCVILIIGGIALLPSLIISDSRMNESLIKIEALKKSQTIEDAHSLSGWLDDLNQKLTVLTLKDDTNGPYEVFTNMISAKQEGISIKSFSLKKDTKQTNLFVTGVASDRQALLNFQNSLNNSGHFSVVTLPIASFAKDRDIDFELSLIPQK